MNSLSETEVDLHVGFTAMNKQRRAFQNWKTASLSSYLEYEKRTYKQDLFFSLSGSVKDLQHNPSTCRNRQLLPHLLPSEAERLSRGGGYWISVHNSTIVINPGRNFLETFHEHGFHVWDIDFVVVTDASQSASSDLLKIHELNKQVNTLLKQWDLPTHSIRYLLHRDAFTQFSPLLQPSYREERSLIEMLATFSDQGIVESIGLKEDTIMEYASCGKQNDPLMLRFTTQGCPSTLGFFSGKGQQAHSPFFEGCKTVILGVGKIDLQCPSHESITGLLHGLQSPLVVISEMDFSEGDMRLETLLALKNYLAEEGRIILPCEEGLCVHLEDHNIEAPGLPQITPASHVRVARTGGAFSPLQYIESSCLL